MATNTVTWGNGYAVSRTGGRLAIIRNTKVFVITYPYLVYVHIYMSTHSREMFAMSDAKRELRTALKIVSRHFNNNPVALKKSSEMRTRTSSPPFSSGHYFSEALARSISPEEALA